MTEEDPKIIVDDDWKEQVQQEKERLLDEAQSSQTEQSAPPVPEASFAFLVTMLSTQALSAMGAIPDPVTGKAEANPQMAKYFIDTLGILESKTQGNLSDDEKRLLEETLHQLRMAFVNRKDQPANNEPETKSSIELP